MIALRLCFALLVFAAGLEPAHADRSKGMAIEKGILSRTAEIDGAKLHYLRAGSGTPLILLHGYTQTSRMWRPIMPLLGEKFLVIAPDLPAIGDSGAPAEGATMKDSAVRIHTLVQSLGLRHASVVGHDIGLMVAYAYAAQFPAEVDKLALMDAFLPGVAGWEIAYNDPSLWHFRFTGPTPAALVRGRERTYFDYYWNQFAADKTRSLPDADRKAYTKAYARAGRLEASWAYFASWPTLAKEFAQLSQTRLEMPVLSIGGEKSMAGLLAQQAKLVAANVTVVTLKDTGHWILEERPQETTQALVKFLTQGAN